MRRLDRQSFLGKDSDALLANATVGIVGLGGGGSHIVQQFAHAGVGRFVIVDPDFIEDTNTNRLIGGTIADVAGAMPKTDIASRIIRGLQPEASITAVRDSWHAATDALKRCDGILGAVDSFAGREQLERFARRHLIPYIDIGMDVHDLGKHGFLVSGQVILSLPGCACLRCCGFITDERLAREDQRYGAAGGRPQVVWPNGILASTAVGLAIQVITPWFARPAPFVYLEYDGNRGTLTQSAHVRALKDAMCPHHLPEEAGDPLFDIRAHLARVKASSTAPALSSSRLRRWLSHIAHWFTN
jgi:hypothetical protein